MRALYYYYRGQQNDFKAYIFKFIQLYLAELKARNNIQHKAAPILLSIFKKKT